MAAVKKSKIKKTVAPKKKGVTKSTLNTMSPMNISIAEFPKKNKSRAPFAAAPAPVQAKKSAKTAAPVQVKSQPVTSVLAKVDVGFGSTLSIRGEGANLSWEKGQPMAWYDNAWHWGTNTKDNFEFKVLVNDTKWSVGENIKATSGDKIEIVPVF